MSSLLWCEITQTAVYIIVTGGDALPCARSVEAVFAAPLNGNQMNSSRTHVAIIDHTLVKYR